LLVEVAEALQQWAVFGLLFFILDQIGSGFWLTITTTGLLSKRSQCYAGYSTVSLASSENSLAFPFRSTAFGK
jgi:hypothetical protein